MRFSVILADEVEPADAKKRRTVRVNKETVYKDIDLLTHKTVDGSGLQDRQVRNAVSSDVAEGVDGSVIARYVEFRNAQLLRHISFALAPITQEAATDSLQLDSNYYYYNIEVDEDWNDNLLRPLAEYMHRFLVFGALYDWYAQFSTNDRQTAHYGAKLDETEEEIASLLRGPSIVKRPLQPFGPSEKFY